MKLALILAVIILTAGAARAETFAFADPARIDSESTEWQRRASELQSDQATKKRENDSALAAAQHAKPVEAQALGEKYQKLAKLNNDAMVTSYKESRAEFEKHRGEIAAALEREKHVTILLAPPAVPNPKRDLTDELIKRLNASDSVALEARVRELEAAAKAKAPPPEPVAKK